MISPTESGGQDPQGLPPNQSIPDKPPAKTNRRTWLFRLVALLLSTLLALAAIEVVVDAIDPNGISYQTSWHFLLYEAFRPAADNTLVWEHIPGYHRHLPAYDVSINSRGLRERPTLDFARTPNTTRILCLGDSFTFGAGVEANQTWPAQVEQRLNTSRNSGGYECINAGVCGYNSMQECALLWIDGARYKPDAVIVFWVGNDFTLTGPTTGLTNDQQTDLLLRQHPQSWKRKLLHGAYEIAPGLTGLTRLFLMPRVYEKPESAESPPQPVISRVDTTATSTGRELNLQALRDMQRFCNADKIPLVIFSWAREPEIEQFCRAEGIQYTYSLPEVSPTEFARYSLTRWDPHLNAAGYQRVAETLGPVIQSGFKVLPPK